MFETAPNHRETGKYVSKQLAYLQIDLIDCNRETDYTANKKSFQ